MRPLALAVLLALAAVAFQSKPPLPAPAYTTYGVTLRFADAEIPQTVSTTACTLKYAPNPAPSLAFYRNGLLQTQNVDYTLSGRAVTLLEPLAPGDTLIAWYRY